MTVDPEAGAGPTATAENGKPSPDVVTPVVVDLGKIKRERVKKLKRGKGPLVDEVLEVLDEVAEELGDELAGATLVPVVLVYERKPKKRRTIELPF